MENYKIIILVLLGIFILSFAWSIWYFTYFPYRPTDIGYMECYNDDGTGPTYQCGDQEVRCYKEKRGGERIPCPFFENKF